MTWANEQTRITAEVADEEIRHVRQCLGLVVPSGEPVPLVLVYVVPDLHPVGLQLLHATARVPSGAAALRFGGLTGGIADALGLAAVGGSAQGTW